MHGKHGSPVGMAQGMVRSCHGMIKANGRSAGIAVVLFGLLGTELFAQQALRDVGPAGTTSVRHGSSSNPIGMPIHNPGVMPSPRMKVIDTAAPAMDEFDQIEPRPNGPGLLPGSTTITNESVPGPSGRMGLPAGTNGFNGRFATPQGRPQPNQNLNRDAQSQVPFRIPDRLFQNASGAHTHSHVGMTTGHHLARNDYFGRSHHAWTNHRMPDSLPHSFGSTFRTTVPFQSQSGGYYFTPGQSSIGGVTPWTNVSRGQVTSHPFGGWNTTGW